MCGALEVSGRGTAQQMASAMCGSHWMASDVGARLNGTLGASCICTTRGSFSQDNEPLLDSGQTGRFTPPD
ncbi:hypothetical protein RSO01_92670 [Reyranella soli]|uniref:Uncharacterized protein n=1 Tax=Reyranella soli TaxID=1230389 RepID=A0A512NT49_9HYPH|nr:hypothetical protein RSO01_92670 [Reyranella soli]